MGASVCMMGLNAVKHTLVRLIQCMSLHAQQVVQSDKNEKAGRRKERGRGEEREEGKVGRRETT